MNTDFITDAMLDDWRRQGFLVVRGVYDAARMVEITKWVDDIQHWPETAGRHMMYFENSSSDPSARLLNRVENFVPYHDRMAGLFDSELRGACSRLFGEEAVLFKEKINFKLPGGGGFEAHQDAQAGWETYAPLYITATVIVDPATVENGCLELAHWDHRKALVGDLWEPLEGDQLAGVEFVPCPAEPRSPRTVLRRQTRILSARYRAPGRQGICLPRMSGRSGRSCGLALTRILGQKSPVRGVFAGGRDGAFGGKMFCLRRNRFDWRRC